MKRLTHWIDPVSYDPQRDVYSFGRFARLRIVLLFGPGDVWSLAKSLVKRLFAA